MLLRHSKLTAGLSLLAVLSCGTASLHAAAAPAAVPLSSAPNGAAITPYPAAGKATGAAVLIVPSQESEGTQLAKWLNEKGIAAFVLRGNAVADIHRGVRTLRAKAADYKISANRIAVVGFAKGAELAAEAAYEQPAEAKADATDPLEKLSGQPDLLALIWGAKVPANVPATSPTTFIAVSTLAADNQGAGIDLWTKLRAARVSVDAHFFKQAPANSGVAANDPVLKVWPEQFYNWARFNGFLTDETRVPIKGMVYLDGNTIPHGYVILTPVDFTGAGPIIARVFNSTAGEALGLFTVPAKQGPVPGKYKVDVRQNMNRWISNSFTSGLTGGRGGTSPEAAYFGHHRALNPTIDDQKSFTKVRPSDKQDYIIEIKPGADANQDLKLEVFSK